MSGLGRIIVAFIVFTQVLRAENFTAWDRFGSGTNQGVGWGDYDNDGDLDLIATTAGFSRLYQNQGGNNFNIAKSFSTLMPYGIAFADLDNDGLLDFAIGDSLGIWVYYYGFNNQTFLAGGPVRSVAWGDYNNDGLVDLAAAIYGGPNRLYRNDGGGNFQLVDNALDSAADSTNSIAWADYNNDGWLDLVTVNHNAINKLYKNDRGTFILQAPFDPNIRNSYGVCWGDYNNDGLLDLLVTNYGDKNRLYRNQGGGFIEVVDVFTTVDSSTGVTFGDFNNDGKLDIAVANYGGYNKLFHNNGDDSFTELRPFGQSVPDSSLGFAAGDQNNDGDLDLAVANHGQNRLYVNNLNNSNYIKVRVNGSGQGYTNRSGIGVKLSLYKTGTDSLVGYREVASGSGFASMDGLEAHFGVTPGNYYLVVRWPASGIVDSVKSISPPKILTVYEDQTPPKNPDTVYSTTHTPRVWSDKQIITMVWSGASDDAGSGIGGYSWSFDTLSNSIPDTIKDLSHLDTTLSTAITFDSRNWYFHIRTVDNAGNWATTGVTAGPYWVDLTPPTPPVLILPPLDKKTNQLRQTFAWHKSADSSGIRQYWLSVVKEDSSSPDIEVDIPNVTDTTIIYNSLSPGVKFWKVLAIDSVFHVGDWSPFSWFAIDTVRPAVLATNPKDGDQGVALNSNIIVTFKDDDIDPATVNENTFTVTGNINKKYSGEISHDGNNYIFDPAKVFYPQEQITCVLSTGIKDNYGNSLPEAYQWDFKTGLAKEDTLGPITSNTWANPETTEGAPYFLLGAKVSDVGTGGSQIQRAEYFMDLRENPGSGDSMLGDFGKQEVLVYDTVNTTGISRGPHIFFVHGMDGHNNWGPFDSVIVWVTGAVGPKLTTTVDKDTIEVGDTLQILVSTTKQLARMEIAILCSDGLQLTPDVRQLDPLHYESQFIAIGASPGLTQVLVKGTDLSDSLVYDTAYFYIREGECLLPPENVYVWPNPVNSPLAHFRYYVTRTSDVKLYIYTLTGKLVLTRMQTDAVGGYNKHEFTVNISNFPNDLYIFKIEAKTKDGSKSWSVVKKFVTAQ